jgi:hypothetical protein
VGTVEAVKQAAPFVLTLPHRCSRIFPGEYYPAKPLCADCGFRSMALQPASDRTRQEATRSPSPFLSV